MEEKFRHPLTDFVLNSFSDYRQCHDATTLASDMAGGFVRKGGQKAYLTVARDVLGCMEMDGLLEKDKEGWYRPRKAASFD